VVEPEGQEPQLGRSRTKYQSRSSLWSTRGG